MSDIIGKLHEYATAQLTREDSAPMRCATFSALNYACKIIAAGEKIQATRVYPALRWIGYDHRYWNMKNDNPDALWDIGEIAENCVLTGDPGIVPYASSSHGLFSNVTSTSYRVSSQAIAIADKDSEKAGIKISELNLFNALEGLDLLVGESDTYFLLRENLFIDESLVRFDFIKKHLTAKRNTMMKMLRE